jgi:ABC-type branched-subunit amino acid transport system ATPase component
VVPDLTVADNLVAGAYQRIKENPLTWLAGLPSTWAKLRAAEQAAYAAAQLLDVDRYWNERCSTLEFSARRRVEIGRCLLSGPRLLLMDEPAAGLDPASTVALFGLIRKLHAELGLTVLLVEHYVKAVLSTCDYVYVLAEGQILASGSPAEIAADPAVQARYLGTRMLARGISTAAAPAAPAALS